MEKVQSRHWTEYLTYVWVFIPAFLYFRMVSHYSVNIPWSDDYDAVLGYLMEFKASSFGHRIGLLFHQQNEHRTLSSNLIYIGYDALFGSINFRGLTFIGNMQLLVVFFISLYFIRKCITKYWGIPAFIWGLCLFDLNSYENAGVAMTSITNYGVVMLFFVSLFFYNMDKKKYLIPAVFFQILCTFSSGGGIVASFILAGYALYTGERTKIKSCIATFLICTPLYFVNYVTPVHETVPRSIKAEATFFLGMMGSHFNYAHGVLFGLLVISTLLIIFPFENGKKIRPAVLPIAGISGFVIATMATAALFRSNVTGVIYYGSKYMIYPNLLAAIIFLFLFLKLKDTKWLWPVTFLFMTGMLYVYSENYKIGRGNFAAENYKLTTRNYYYPDSVRAKIITEDACKAGIYCRQDKK